MAKVHKNQLMQTTINMEQLDFKPDMMRTAEDIVRINLTSTYSTLGNLLQAIANAIRAKKGTSSPINAQDFPSEIASIQSGGGGVDAIAEAFGTHPYVEEDRFEWFMELEVVLLPGFDYFSLMEGNQPKYRCYYSNGLINKVLTNLVSDGNTQDITRYLHFTYSQTDLNGTTYPMILMVECYSGATYTAPSSYRIEFGYEY